MCYFRVFVVCVVSYCVYFAFDCIFVIYVLVYLWLCVAFLFDYVGLFSFVVSLLLVLFSIMLPAPVPHLFPFDVVPPFFLPPGFVSSCC